MLFLVSFPSPPLARKWLNETHLSRLVLPKTTTKSAKMRFLFDRPTRNALRWNMEVKYMVGPYIKIRLYCHTCMYLFLTFYLFAMTYFLWFPDSSNSWDKCLQQSLYRYMKIHTKRGGFAATNFREDDVL